MTYMVVSWLQNDLWSLFLKFWKEKQERVPMYNAFKAMHRFSFIWGVAGVAGKLILICFIVLTKMFVLHGNPREFSNEKNHSRVWNWKQWSLNFEDEPSMCNFAFRYVWKPYLFQMKYFCTRPVELELSKTRSAFYLSLYVLDFKHVLSLCVELIWFGRLQTSRELSVYYQLHVQLETLWWRFLFKSELFWI